MAHALNLEVVAEGVETKEHVERLTSVGCHELQGFYFSPALPAEDFVHFYKNFSL